MGKGELFIIVIEILEILIFDKNSWTFFVWKPVLMTIQSWRNVIFQFDFHSTFPVKIFYVEIPQLSKTAKIRNITPSSWSHSWISLLSDYSIHPKKKTF